MAEAANTTSSRTKNRPGARRAPSRYSLGSGYSSFVMIMKLALPAVAVGLVLLIVIWPQFWDDAARFNLPALEVTPEDIDGRQMISPNYQGFDKNNRPFSVTADLATQKPGNQNLVDLTRPKANIKLKSGSWVAVNAENGLYDQERQTMKLRGGVRLDHDDGFSMTTERVTVRIDEGTADSPSPVRGEGPDGNLTGEGFRMLDEGARILLTGKSRVTLYETGERKNQ